MAFCDRLTGAISLFLTIWRGWLVRLRTFRQAASVGETTIYDPAWSVGVTIIDGLAADTGWQRVRRAAAIARRRQRQRDHPSALKKTSQGVSLHVCARPPLVCPLTDGSGFCRVDN